MADRGDDWMKQGLTILVVVLGLSSAGTLVSISGNRAATPPAGAATKPATFVDASRADRPGWQKPFELLRELLQPVPPPPPAERTGAGSGKDAVPAEALHPVNALAEYAGHSGNTVGFVVATVPDWVDSSLQWTFDPIIDAIQTAAGQMGYVPAGYHLPDTDASARAAEGQPASRSQGMHESEPGALLFRRAVPATASGKSSAPVRPDVLMVLLVGESAIRGVHPGALSAAVELSARWSSADAAREVRILGPTYSGSAGTMRATLTAIQQQPFASKVTFDIVTPSASSPHIRKVLENPQIGRFRSVTRSDDEVLAALAGFLGQIDHGWRCGKRVALLVEANTTWGRGFFVRDEESSTAAKPVNASPSGGRISKNTACSRCMHSDPAAPFVAGASLMPCAVVLPFPLHVSRLRSEAARAADVASGIQVPSPAMVGLPMNDPAVATDRVPSMSPVLTAANVETMLAGVFRAINERGVTAVGVLATDKRDHLFLAEEIAKRSPNVLPFTLESNVVYLHPDVSSYVRGTVVASTYAANDRTQFLTRPTLANHLRHQFPSSAAEGAYNALLLLMGEHRHLLDYDTPAGPGQEVPALPQQGPCQPHRSSCRPPVWISIVARGSMMPLASAPPQPGLETGYATAVKVEKGDDPSNSTQVTESRPQQDYITSHRVFWVLVAALAALIAWHWWQVVREGLLRQLPGDKVEALNAERRAGRFALEGATVALLLWLAKLALVYLADQNHQSVDRWREVYVAVTFIAGVLLVVRAVQSFWKWPARDGRARAAVAATAVFTASVLLWCLVSRQEHREALVAVATVAGLLACFADITWRGLRAAGSDVAHWRRLPVLLGVGAVTCLVVHFAVDSWTPVEAVLYADRMASLGSLVSPAPIIVTLCCAVYWWGAWNLRRVQLMRLPETEVGVGDLLKRRALRGGTRPAEVFEQPSLTVGAFMVLPALLVAYALWAGTSRVGSIDGRVFGGYLLLGAMCVLSITGHTLAHTLHLGSAVLATLRALGRHPAAKLFETIGKENFFWRMTFQEITLSELEPLMRRVELAVANGRRWTGDDEAILSVAELAAREGWRPHADAVLQTSRKDPLAERSGEQLVLGDWQRLQALTGDFYAILRATRWRADFEPASGSMALQSTLEHMEYVVLFHGAIVLRDLLTRLVSGFTAVFGALLMLMLGHLLYSFQGREFWLMLDWVTIGMTGLVGMRMLVALDKDFVLSRLWDTTPGQVSVFGGLSWRMLGYLAISLVALFAAFFPEVGGGAGKWLDPIRKLIP